MDSGSGKEAQEVRLNQVEERASVPEDTTATLYEFKAFEKERFRKNEPVHYIKQVCNDLKAAKVTQQQMETLTYH